MKKPLPILPTDEAAEAFVTSADLSLFDLSAFKPGQFEFATKDARINMRLPEKLLDAVKAEAKREGMPYQRFIRQAIEQAIARPKSAKTGAN